MTQLRSTMRVSSGVHNVRPDGAQPWTGACPPQSPECETASWAGPDGGGAHTEPGRVRTPAQQPNQ